MNAELLTLGRNIRRLRRGLGISQEKLAEKCGLHRTYVCDVERGSRNPSFLTLLAIARGLDATISELTLEMKAHVVPSQTGLQWDFAHMAKKTGKNTSARRSYLSRE